MHTVVAVAGNWIIPRNKRGVCVAHIALAKINFHKCIHRVLVYGVYLFSTVFKLLFTHTLAWIYVFRLVFSHASFSLGRVCFACGCLGFQYVRRTCATNVFTTHTYSSIFTYSVIIAD